MRANTHIRNRPTVDFCTCITRTAAQPRDLLRNLSRSPFRPRTKSWNWTTAQTQGKLRTVCARSAAVGTTGTVARSSLQDPEAAEVTTRTGREPGLNLVTTMAATVVAKVVARVAATDHATGCPPVQGTAAAEVVAVKAAGDRE